jgi:hypothetical protein
VEAVEPLALKGKSQPVPAYRLITVKQAAERRQLLAPMIGRERELRRLEDAFAQAVDDRSCQLFTILGAAGVGKSRLAYECLGNVDGARVVRGRCLSYGEGITYFPVIEVIKQLDALPTDEYAASSLQSLLGESQAATSAEEIAWAFRKLLDEQAQAQPLVVVFDDIHWGEETFLDLIEHAAELSRDAPILLLCMARPELLEKRPGWGAGSGMPPPCSSSHLERGRPTNSSTRWAGSAMGCGSGSGSQRKAIRSLSRRWWRCCAPRERPR